MHSALRLSIARQQGRPLMAHHQTARRRVASYLRQVLGSLYPAKDNPLLEVYLQPQQQQQGSEDGNHTMQKLPNFSAAQPHDLEAALDHVDKEQSGAIEELRDLVEKDGLSDESALRELLTLINAAQEPSYTLRQMSSILWLLSEEQSLSEWRQAAANASALESWQDDAKLSTRVHTKLRELASSSSFDSNDSDDSNELHWSANDLLRQHKHKTGDHLENSEHRENYTRMTQALEKVNESLLETKSPAATQQLLSDMYNFIGIRTEQAKLLGYGNFAQQVFCGNTAANIDEIQQLHKDVAERLVPQIVTEYGAKKSKDQLALDAYLSDTKNSNTPAKNTTIGGSASSQERRRHDEWSMLRLEQHVTLDGALQFLFRLSQDLFGITIQQQNENVNAWHPDVRLYHVYTNNDENNKYVGSFYLDPFQRKGKLARSATIPLFAKGKHPCRHPVVCVTLEVEPPPWDTDPAVLTWDDCESLFHELGHVVHFMLARSSRGCLVGPEKMPLDLTEFLPKFMEHWLTEKTTLNALITLSQIGAPLSDESIDAAYRVRSRTKALKLAQQCFYGSLELELFSGFDLQGSETILDLQERLAKELIPHDAPDKKDATPLLDILQENARGRHVAWYRYLWCDAMSATAFEHFKEKYSSNRDSMGKLRADFGRLLLEPGAAIDVKEFRSEFGLNECSPEALCNRYQL